MEPFIIYLERDIVRCMIMYTRKKNIYIYHNVTKLKLIRLVTSGWLLQGDEKNYFFFLSISDLRILNIGESSL